MGVEVDVPRVCHLSPSRLLFGFVALVFSITLADVIILMFRIFVLVAVPRVSHLSIDLGAEKLSVYALPAIVKNLERTVIKRHATQRNRGHTV